jgi:hypothetical protein
MKNTGMLNGNHLKLIAATTMLLDHMGVLLFPRMEIFRIVGRLAYPIFAFMIAEGCHYTKNKLRYFLMVFGLGAACQTVYYFFSGDTHMNILLTFSCSILLSYLLMAVKQSNDWRKRYLWSSLFAAGVFAALAIDWLLDIDYGFWGIMAPVFVTFTQGEGKTGSKLPVLMMFVSLLLLGAAMGEPQYYALLAIPLLLLYNGQRGKTNMKYFFYIFYPVHLVVLQGIAWLVR